MKNFKKTLIVVTFVGFGIFPIAFAMTTPEHLAWLFYTSLAMGFGGTMALLGTILFELID